MSSSASQREIPPDLVYPDGSRPSSFDDGAVLLIDKPKGITSFDVVEAVRDETGVGKVGHAGTLDPMATGLLIILVARPATRLQEAFTSFTKAYQGTMRLGQRTPSHDSETDIVDEADPSHLTLAEIAAARNEFTGEIQQVPPMYSALKVDGEPLYKKARRGETVDRPPRQVRIDSFDLVDWSSPDLSFSIVCSKGTYVRSLARDLGDALEVGAHLIALRRTEIGPYSVDDAWSLGDLKSSLSNRMTDPDEA